jgi:hypothetical protein
MVLINQKWKILTQPGLNISIKILAMLLFTLLFSCEKPLYVNCEECYPDQPVDCIVEIMLGSDLPGQPPSEITIYFGRMEDGIIIDSFVASYSSSFTALINNEYTIVASTIIDDREYRAVNSVKPEYLLIENMCTDDCYIIRHNKVNMNLKYY